MNVNGYRSCGHIYSCNCNQFTATLKKEINRRIQTEKALVDTLSYLEPGTSRGPAIDGWVKMMRQVAEVLEWKVCYKCDGTCKSINRHWDICTCCLAVGKLPPDRF